jgi:hypothetical protein
VRTLPSCCDPVLNWDDRVVSAESDRWVTSMDDASISGQERRDLFARATQKHIERARLAGSGQGVDRHLLGLRSLVLPDEDVPALYADALFGRAKNWVLSTSALNSQYCIGYGWGEVVPEGFGVAYLTCYDGQSSSLVTHCVLLTSKRRPPSVQRDVAQRDAERAVLRRDHQGVERHVPPVQRSSDAQIEVVMYLFCI